VSPGDGATDVAVDAVVSVTFGEALDPASVAAATLVLRPAGGGAAVAGSVALAGATVTFTPAAPLAHATSYAATVSGVRDGAGNALAAAHVWSFGTAPAQGAVGPLVVSKTPS
jgi:hypothetical protein